MITPTEIPLDPRAARPVVAYCDPCRRPKKKPTDSGEPFAAAY